MSDPFFSRWSRRKQEAQAGRALDEPPPPAAPTTTAPQAPAPVPCEVGTAAAQAQASVDAPLPSLEEAQALEPSSDFQPFMRRGVSPDVRNLAMKKLFADPHFNVMDGLDIYIGDYTQPDPLPPGMLAQMAGAQFLNLVPPQATPQAASPEGAHGRVATEENPDWYPQTQQMSSVVAQSPDSAAPMAAGNTDHDNTDLQLQPDPASADRQAGAGPR